MQYCRFQTEDGPQYGELELRQGELWLARTIAPPPEDWSVVRLEKTIPAQPLANLQLLAPVTPSKIVCVGRNYRDHAAELGNDVPKEPLLFFKPPSAIVGLGAAIQLPAASKRVDYEGELGVVMARTCHNLADDADVRPYIRGYVAVNDVTARDLQKTDNQWARAKGFDTFCPVGPYVSGGLDPAAGLTVVTRVNGQERQRGSTKDLIFDIAFLVRYISRIMTLEPGDLIATGTPAGVGPLENGHVVEVEVEGAGVLRNPVVAP